MTKKFNKKLWIPIIVLVSVLVVLAVTYTVLWFTVLSTDLTVDASQIGQEQSVVVTWDCEKPAREVIVEVVHDGNLYYKVNINDGSAIAKSQIEVPAFYGKQEIKVTVKRTLGYSKTQTKNVNVFTDTYNIAPLTATMPVTLFSLSLPEITQNYTIPTFVWFKRSGAWDYKNMPDNVYTMPVASYTQITGDSNQKTIYSATSAWIKELYEINPSSHFNLYYNDYYAYGWLQATVANGIDASNYNVYLLSDGTASFSYFNEHFDNENWATEYASMKADYEQVKQQIADRGTYKESSKGFKISANEIREYAFVMAKEESNVEWWLTRISGTLANNTPEAYTEVSTTASVKVKGLNDLLNANYPQENDKTQLKSLYKFSEDVFSKAETEGKKIMILLGTWTDTENSSNFSEYVKAIQKFYGNEYVYYYKGHPKNPTNSVPGKLQKLEDLGLIDIDSTIPAELFFLFNPEAHATGYSSSTYTSLNDEQTMAVWNVRLDSFGESYKSNVDFFISKVDIGDAKYGSLVSNTNSFVLEFQDGGNYDIAIYNSAKDIIKYYKDNGGIYNEVA